MRGSFSCFPAPVIPGESTCVHNQYSTLNLTQVCLCSHPAVMAELIAVLFALMGADEELQVVSSQHFLSDIWPPVAASASYLIGNAAILGHWVTPQHVHYLGGQINHNEKVSEVRKCQNNNKKQ